MKIMTANILSKRICFFYTGHINTKSVKSTQPLRNNCSYNCIGSRYFQPGKKTGAKHLEISHGGKSVPGWLPHGLHQTNGIRIHTFISIQQSDCNWEKSGDHNQSDLRCHSKSHPKHQNWRNGNGRYGLRNDHDRIKCLIHYTEPIHHSCKHKCQRDSNEKSVKRIPAK